MRKSISILGCGWLGLALSIKLIDNGHTVRGSTTTPTKLIELKGKGIKPFHLDLSKINSTISEFLCSEILIVSVTSKNYKDFINLIEHINLSSIKKIIFISSTSVYPNCNKVVTEDSSTNDSLLIQIEKLFRSNTKTETTIIRFGGLFGYNRHPGNFHKGDKPIDNPEGYVNLIHQDDCVRIVSQIIDQNIWNETFNACCNSHPKRREFFLKERESFGAAKTMFNENSLNQYKIVDSGKLVRELNYAFKIPDLLNL